MQYLQPYYTDHPHRLSTLSVSLNGADSEQVENHSMETSNLLAGIKGIPNTGYLSI